MQQVKREKISDEEAKELTQFVTDLLMIDYKTFQENKSAFPWYWSKIMKFFRLPKTKLHEQYMEWCRPTKELREKNEAWKILWKMDAMKDKLKSDENLMDSEVRYQIIKRHEIWHKFWWADEYVTIWIPYYDNSEKKTRYYWTINVYQSVTPELFKKICESFRRFTWDPEIMLH